MLPILLVLLFGAGLVAALLLGLGALLRHLRRSPAPTSTRVVTGVFGLAGLGVASLAGGVLFVALLATTTATAFLRYGPVRSIQVLRLDGDVLAAQGLGGAGLAGDGFSEWSRDSSISSIGWDEGASEEERDALSEYRRAADGLDLDYPVHVLVEYRGTVSLDRLHRWLEHETEGRVHLVDARPVPSDGERLTLLDFGLDLEPEEVAEFEAEFEGSQPFFDLPHSLRIELRERAE